MESTTSASYSNSEHKELYDFVSGLPTHDLIELLNIACKQDEQQIPGKLKDDDKFRKLYVDGIINMLIEREYEEDDIREIRLALYFRIL